MQGNVSVKDSQIARLEGRVAGYERASTLNNSSGLTPGYDGPSQLAANIIKQNEQQRQVETNNQLTTLPICNTDSNNQVEDMNFSKLVADNRVSQVGDNRVSQDDSIVSLLNRMRIHEQHVQDVLHDRLSSSMNGDLNRIGKEFAVNTASACGDDDESAKNVYSSQSGGQEDVVVDKIGSSLGSFTSSGRGTLIASSDTETNLVTDPQDQTDQLAEYLAQDPNSFQALFKKLRNSYSTNTPSGEELQDGEKMAGKNPSAVNFGGNVLRPTLSYDFNQFNHGTMDFAKLVRSEEALLRQKQQEQNLIPTKDTLPQGVSQSKDRMPPPSNADEIIKPAKGVGATKEVTGQSKGLIHPAEISLISSISDSESVTKLKKKSKSVLSSGGVQQFTSSPKAVKTGKKVRIVTQPLVPAKSGAKSTAVKSTGGKNTKKSTMAKKVGTGSSSKLSTSGSANDSEALKTSHFGSILAKGLADIEAAAHPYRSKLIKQSPAETQDSPNISTAISHYTNEDNDNDGSFLSTGPISSTGDSGGGVAVRPVISLQDLSPESCMAVLQQRRREIDNM